MRFTTRFGAEPDVGSVEGKIAVRASALEGWEPLYAYSGKEKDVSDPAETICTSGEAVLILEWRKVVLIRISPEAVLVWKSFEAVPNRKSAEVVPIRKSSDPVLIESRRKAR